MGLNREIKKFHLNVKTCSYFLETIMNKKKSSDSFVMINMGRNGERKEMIVTSFDF